MDCSLRAGRDPARPGLRVGASTIERLAAAQRIAPFVERRTASGLFVFDREGQPQPIAVDNAGFYKAFYDDTSVSTSLLQLVAAEGKRVEFISPTAAAGFVATAERTRYQVLRQGGEVTPLVRKVQSGEGSLVVSITADAFLDLSETA